MVRIVGERNGIRRFFVEPGNPIVFVHGDDPEARGFLDGAVDGSDDRLRPRCDEPVLHLRVVPLVDVVARENQQELGMFIIDQEHVLIDGVGCAAIPIFADALLRRNRGDVFVEVSAEDVPAGSDMAIERMRFVLDEDGDFTEPRVQTVAERKIDDPIFPAEGNCWFGPLCRERIEPLSFSAGQDHGENILHGVDSSRTDLK